MSRLTILIPAIALLSVVSCTKEASAVAVAEETVRVSFRAPHSTKTAGPEVSSVDVVAYDAATGTLAAHARSADGGGTVTVTLPKTRRVDWFTVGNAPEDAFASAATRDLFDSTFLRLSDCSPRVVMSASGSGLYSESGTVPVTLDRAVARIELDGVTARYLQDDDSLHLSRVFLINVRGDLPYSLVQTPDGRWLNRLALDGDLGEKEREMLVAERDIVLHPETASVDVTLECLPNPVDNGVTSLTQPQWSPRNTRLVLEVEDRGQTLYYPATLPAVKGNIIYRIKDLVLIGEGSHLPDYPPGRDQVEFEITVTPWGANDVSADFK